MKAHGWELAEDDNYNFKWFEEPQMPKTVRDIFFDNAIDDDMDDEQADDNIDNSENDENEDDSGASKSARGFWNSKF